MDSTIVLFCLLSKWFMSTHRLKESWRISVCHSYREVCREVRVLRNLAIKGCWQKEAREKTKNKISRNKKHVLLPPLVFSTWFGATLLPPVIHARNLGCIYGSPFFFASLILLNNMPILITTYIFVIFPLLFSPEITICFMSQQN